MSAIDLVERLRGRVNIETACGNRTANRMNHVQLMDEAADTITRLQAALDWAENYDPEFVAKIRERASVGGE